MQFFIFFLPLGGSLTAGTKPHTCFAAFSNATAAAAPAPFFAHAFYVVLGSTVEIPSAVVPLLKSSARPRRRYFALSFVHCYSVPSIHWTFCRHRVRFIDLSTYFYVRRRKKGLWSIVYLFFFDSQTGWSFVSDFILEKSQLMLMLYADRHLSLSNVSHLIDVT